MSIDMELEIEKIMRLADNGEKQKALNETGKLLEITGNDPKLWSLQSFLYARVKDYQRALESISRAITMSPHEASYYYQRGRYNFKINLMNEAAVDFTCAIRLHDKNDMSFLQVLHFFRAEIFIKLRDRERAISDLRIVPDDFEWWTFKLRTKRDLMEDVEKL